MRKVILIGLFLVLCGCGQKGPLFLPEQAPTNQEEPENKESEENNSVEVIK